MYTIFHDIKKVFLKTNSNIIISEKGFEDVQFTGFSDIDELSCKLIEKMSWNAPYTIWDLTDLYIIDNTMIGVLKFPKCINNSHDNTKWESGEDCSNRFVCNIINHLNVYVATFCLCNNTNFEKMYKYLDMYQEFFNYMKEYLCNYVPNELHSIVDEYRYFVTELESSNTRSSDFLEFSEDINKTYIKQNQKKGIQ